MLACPTSRSHANGCVVAKTRHRLNRGGAPGRIVDLLTSNWGEWFTAEEIATEFSYRWPGTNRDTIRAAFQRLHRDKHPDLIFSMKEAPAGSICGRDRYKEVLVAKGLMPSFEWDT